VPESHHHHHRHSSDSGIATLIGLILTFILLRAYLVGDLFKLVNIVGFRTGGFESVDMESPGSIGLASFIIISFLANVIYGVGQFAILAWSGLGWVLSDIVAGYRRWSTERMGIHIDQPTVSPSPASVRVVEPDPLEQILGQFQDNLLTLQESLSDLSDRVDSLATPKPAGRTTTRARAKA